MSIAMCRLRVSFSRSCYASQVKGRAVCHRMFFPRTRYRHSYSRTLQETRARRKKGSNSDVPVEAPTQKIEVVTSEKENIEEEDVELRGQFDIEQEQEEEEELMERVIDQPPVFPMTPSKSFDVASMTTPALPPWIMNFITRPKEAMTELMMKQMANAMKQQGMGMGSPGPTSPYGNMSQGFGGSGSGSGSPPVDTYASTVPQSPSEKTTINTTTATVGSTTPTPTPKSTPKSTAESPKDVGNGNTTTNQQSTMKGDGDSDAAVDFMFEMLKDPTMRDSLYQFLPESMRNPETLETVMQSPMVREQFKTMMTPEMIQQMKSFQGSMSDPNLKQQLDNMSVSPDVLMKKLMNEPELWSLLQKPNVMQAVMDLQQNPNNMTKYMNDPEVMQVMMKMNELTFQAQSEMAASTPDEGKHQQQQSNTTIDVPSSPPPSPPPVENSSTN